MRLLRYLHGGHRFIDHFFNHPCPHHLFCHRIHGFSNLWELHETVRISVTSVTSVINIIDVFGVDMK